MKTHLSISAGNVENGIDFDRGIFVVAPVPENAASTCCGPAAETVSISRSINNICAR